MSFPTVYYITQVIPPCYTAGYAMCVCVSFGACVYRSLGSTVHGDLSLVADVFMCKQCDGIIQEADLGT